MTWIDFRQLKERVAIRDVLDHYGMLGGLRDRGHGQLSGPCPLHSGDNRNAFHVNTDKNVWHCFTSCGGGNILDLVMKVEGCSIREAGQKLTEWFDIKSTPPPRTLKGREAAAKAVRPSSRRNSLPPAATIPPLLPLKTLDPAHPYLAERGLSRATVDRFGIGYCSRGIMRGRIAIPIHTQEGELVAYAGRAVAPTLAAEAGKYKFPTGFEKRYVVWNLNRATICADRGLIVCEGYFGAMRVDQAGFPSVVALMGSSLSEEQEALLVAATDRLALMFDGDEAGVAALRSVYARLRGRMYLREIHLEQGEQPDNLPDERLQTLLR